MKWCTELNSIQWGGLCSTKLLLNQTLTDNWPGKQGGIYQRSASTRQPTSLLQEYTESGVYVCLCVRARGGQTPFQSCAFQPVCWLRHLKKISPTATINLCAFLYWMLQISHLISHLHMKSITFTSTISVLLEPNCNSPENERGENI